ncbi:hypothetical protein SAMN04487891_11723 [Flagellimonas taeanensis]|uniref:Uncharacterized protein n=1 Tax=Flagellimonas taeanensis TaxID=1005926 RepID=A0A1M7CR99_9FLAO|nr:hypothetical protein SAMN04487891_11723 [Allomuricauda taeanensis]SHL69697.1 hypothetical protein SAMN05216293_4091 [Allomuricauda taeanensis]
MAPLSEGAIHKLTNSKKCKKLTQPYVTHSYQCWHRTDSLMVQRYDHFV